MVRGSCAQLGGGTTTASPVAPVRREVQRMSHLARGGFAAMCAALALLVGTPRRAGATPNNANCKPNRATCTANNQCCSGACTAGLCATPTTTTSTSTSTTTSSTTPTSSTTTTSTTTSTTTTTLRFVDNGDGTVTDNETGLIWEKKTGTVGTAVNCATTTCSDPHDLNNTYTWSSSGTAADGRAFTDFLSRRCDLRPDRGVQLLVVYYLRHRSRLRLGRRVRHWDREQRRQGQQQLRPRGAGRLVIDHLLIRVI